MLDMSDGGISESAIIQPIRHAGDYLFLKRPVPCAGMIDIIKWLGIPIGGFLFRRHLGSIH